MDCTNMDSPLVIAVILKISGHRDPAALFETRTTDRELILASQA